MQTNHVKQSRRFLAVAALVVLAAWTVPSIAQDPVEIGPDIYKVVFENDRVRVMEVTFGPGAKIGKHSHPDHFGYALTAGTLKITNAKGETMEAALTPGQVVWIPAETHSSENRGDKEIRILVVELKEPAPAKKESSSPK